MPPPEISSSPGAASKRLRPKTYVLALYITLAVALVQVLVLGSIFWLRHKVKIDTRSPAPVFGHSPVPSLRPLSAPGESPVPAASEPPVPITLQPTLGAARLPVPANPVQEIADLDRKAYDSMREGEYDLARVALLQAENIDSRHPLTLRYEAELAEAEADWSRAADYWRRLVDLGPAAGELAAIAPSRLAAARAHLMATTLAEAQAKAAPPSAPAKAAASPNSTAPAPAPAPSQGEALEPPPSTPAAVPATPAATNGNAMPIFHVLPAERAPLAGNAALSGFTLRLPIVPANAAAAIDPGKVGIKLFFYDQVPGGVIVPTNAHLDVAFENPHVTWLGGRSEVLRAVYRRAAEGSAGAQSYYGYVFRLYYDGKLVEERSDPSSLLALFPVSS